MRDLITAFISENSRTRQKLDEEYGKKNWHELQRTAHKLKSSLALVGLEEQRAKAEELESMAGTDLSKTKELVDELSETLRQAIHEMEEKLRTW